jgi:hypothetical protein
VETVYGRWPIRSAPWSQRGIRSSGKPIKMVDHAQGWQAACRRFGRNGLLP